MCNERRSAGRSGAGVGQLKLLTLLEVLRIDVIFDGNINELDGGKLSSALQHVRSGLNEIHESAIPLLSFISKADLHRRKRVSA
jgi:hypothetical protein